MGRYLSSWLWGTWLKIIRWKGKILQYTYWQNIIMILMKNLLLTSIRIKETVCDRNIHVLFCRVIFKISKKHLKLWHKIYLLFAFIYIKNIVIHFLKWLIVPCTMECSFSRLLLLTFVLHLILQIYWRNHLHLPPS